MKVIHSGGAKGADYTWGKFGKEYGYEVKHYYYKNKTPYGNCEISFQEFQEGLEYAKQALTTFTDFFSQARIKCTADLADFLLCRFGFCGFLIYPIFFIFPHILFSTTFYLAQYL